MKNNCVNLYTQNNVDFKFSVDVGYIIGTSVPLMKIDTVDCSSFLTVSGSVIDIDIPFATMQTIGIGLKKYDLILSIDPTHRELIISGEVNILQGTY